MTGEQEFEIGGRAAQRLWGRVAQTRSVPTGEAIERPDPMLLAAWLEGHLSEAESVPVETWLARSPDALEDVALLRAAVDDDERAATAAPPAFVARAQAVVREPAKVTVERGSWLGALLGQPLLRWGGVAALALMVGFGGFQMGNQGLAPSLATLQTSQVTQASQLTVADFGAQPTPFM